jgi:hypothetical protein
MTYDVTYQVAGDERTERLTAPDAATAAATIRDSHGRSSERFELILVHLVEEGEGDDSPAVFGEGAVSANP